MVPMMMPMQPAPVMQTPSGMVPLQMMFPAGALPMGLPATLGDPLSFVAPPGEIAAGFPMAAATATDSSNVAAVETETSPELPNCDASAVDPMSIYQATASAQEMQYLLQFQFYQQLQVQEAQRRQKDQVQVQSRFKEGFRPMRLCKHLLLMGMCQQGANCTFGHVYEELHPASPDIPRDFAASSGSTSLLAEQGETTNSNVPDMRLKKKKEMCIRFSRGECSLAKICPFAHSQSELGTIALSVCGKVKTRLCVFWEPDLKSAKGCIYGRNCNNAHGEQEIGTRRPAPEVAPPVKRRREGEPAVMSED